MKAIRETSFISSATNSETPEYKLLRQLTPELRTAIQDDLQGISDRLLSWGMITQDGHEDFTNCYKSTHIRAASLIRAVQNKVKSDRHYFSKFVKVLEKNKQYYNSILQKIYSHDMDSPPMYSQDDSGESDEASTLLHVPYVQYQDESQSHKPERRISWSNIAFYIIFSGCIVTEFALDRPLKTFWIQFMISVFLIILLYIGLLIPNITTVFFVTLILAIIINNVICCMFCMCLCCDSA